MTKPSHRTAALTLAASCANPTCSHPITSHRGYGNGGRPGRCEDPACACRRWQRTRPRSAARRPSGRPRQRRTRVYYKAPGAAAIEAIEAIAQPAASVGADLRRIVLRLGLRALRAELDQLEREL